MNNQITILYFSDIHVGDGKWKYWWKCLHLGLIVCKSWWHLSSNIDGTNMKCSINVPSMSRVSRNKNPCKCLTYRD